MKTLLKRVFAPDLVDACSNQIAKIINTEDINRIKKIANNGCKKVLIKLEGATQC